MTPAESTPDSEFEQLDDSKSVSQLIRSNAMHYWAHMKDKIDLRRLQPYIEFAGMTAGDAHPGNFAALPLRTVGGQRQMRFVNVDFDDAGHAPLVLDFIRFVIACKAINADIKRHSLQKAYVAGLAGHDMDPPAKVRECLELSVSDYDNVVAAYADKRSSKDRFILEAGEIEAYDGKIPRAAIEKLFSDGEVIDIALRPRERGGSLNQLRIWVLVRSRNSRRRIMELKQYAEPATACYEKQPPVERWLHDVREAFWPGLDGSAYDLISLPGHGLFWLREKAVSLIDVPYSSDHAKKVDFLEDLASFDAYQLGLAHGRQTHATNYRAAIEHDDEGFRDATKSVEKAYLEAADKAFTKK